MAASNHARDRYLSQDDAALKGECEVHTYRASGPGGQKRNKTDSAVRLRHRPTGLMVTAAESRSQHENRARAVKRLRQAIALTIRALVDVDHYAPGPLLKGCLTAASGIQIGRKDHRYHQVVAEVLDVLAACDCRMSLTAAKIGVTTGKLAAFFRKDPKLWKRVNEMRGSADLSRLRASR